MAILLVVVSLLGTSAPATAEPVVPGGTFTDDDGNVHEGFIEAIAEAGITKGCNPPSNYLYCPDQAVTRGQMAAFLVRALGIPRSSANAFEDDEESVFQADINALAAIGVTRGCNPPANNRFCPDQAITRGQMAAFLVRAFGYSDPGVDDPFNDVDGIFKGDIERLAAAGITKGCNPPVNDRYCPEELVRRDQMASFLARALGLNPIVPPTPAQRIVVDEDTMIMHERMVLRAGDSIEFRNGARLMIHTGASVDWQGTPTTTWSDDGLTQNLTRDVKIFGHGDIMFMEGSKPSILRFVEIDLQPKEELGHYPLHWHLVGNGSRGTLVEGVVVKNSTNRAFVPHGSHGITFRDTIASNVRGPSYWWDNLNHPEDHSHDILYDRILAIDSYSFDSKDKTHTAIDLGAGTGNVIRDSVARNIDGTKNCSGFRWPGFNIHFSGVWEATNLKTFNSKCHGIWVWQNSNDDHVIDGFSGGEGISHGAYTTRYEYRNIDVPYMHVHAVGWSVTSGRIDEVRTFTHKKVGTVTFRDVEIGAFVVDSGLGNGVAIHHVLENTGIACEDVMWASWIPGTTMEVDGADCLPPS